MKLFKVAGQEHPDRHRPTGRIKQWMAPTVDTQLEQPFHTQLHQKLRVQGSSIYHQERSHKPKNAHHQIVLLAEKWRMEVADTYGKIPYTERLILILSPFPVSVVLYIREVPHNDISFSASFSLLLLFQVRSPVSSSNTPAS